MNGTAKNPEGFTLKQRLHPNRFPGMSPKMVAMLGWLLDEQFTDPAIADITVTSDRMVLAQNSGDIGFNAFIGAESEFVNNIERLFECVPDLEGSEAELLREKMRAKGIKI